MDSDCYLFIGGVLDGKKHCVPLSSSTDYTYKYILPEKSLTAYMVGQNPCEDIEVQYGREHYETFPIRIADKQWHVYVLKGMTMEHVMAKLITNYNPTPIHQSQ